MWPVVYCGLMIFILLGIPKIASGQDASSTKGLEQFAWKNRMLMISDPLDEKERAQAMIKHFFSKLEAMDDRQLLLFYVQDGTADMVNGSSVKVELRAGELKKYGISRKAFQVILIGLDGQVKRKWSESPSPQEVCDIIDAMPMRINEVRYKKTN